MPTYPHKRKMAILNKLASPQGPTIAQLAKDEGISEATLYNWRQKAQQNGQLMPRKHYDTSGFSAIDRFNAVVETAALPQAELAEYCRQKGFYPEQILRWKQACLAGCDTKPAITEQDAAKLRKEDKTKISRLKKELYRKEKALAEAAAIIILQKKLAPLLAGEDA